jgi:hypothetical protein
VTGYAPPGASREEVLATIVTSLPGVAFAFVVVLIGYSL